MKFLLVYCLCEKNSPQASIIGPSCAQEDLANLELVKIFSLCSLRYNKIFPFSIDLRFSLLPVLHLLAYLQRKKFNIQSGFSVYNKMYTMIVSEL